VFSNPRPETSRYDDDDNDDNKIIIIITIIMAIGLKQHRHMKVAN
jgi:hypothetical protein